MPSLNIDPRRRVGIEGANGSGKSTLLRVLAGLERDFDGICQVQTNLQRRVYVDQRTCLFRGTVLFNATYGLRARGLHRREAQKVALELLDKLGIRSLSGVQAERISSGERRRTALVRAISLKPKLLLLDEPTVEMDTRGVDCLRQLIEELPDSTILISSPNSIPDGFVNEIYPLDSA